MGPFDTSGGSELCYAKTVTWAGIHVGGCREQSTVGGREPFRVRSSRCREGETREIRSICRGGGSGWTERDVMHFPNAAESDLDDRAAGRYGPSHTGRGPDSCGDLDHGASSHDRAESNRGPTYPD